MREEVVAMLLRAILSQDEAEKQKALARYCGEGDKTEWEKFLKFSKKEISTMPERFRKLFRVEGLPVHCRKRVRGRSVNYEIRCRAQGYNICACGTTMDGAKARFIEKLREIEGGKKVAIPSKFGEFAQYYFEKYRKKKVAAQTYKNDVNRIKNHVLPAIGDMQIGRITPSDIDDILEKFGHAGKTAEEIYSLLRAVFKSAVAHHLIQYSPMDTVDAPTHEREHGVALTREEEALLFARLPVELRERFAVALYCGLRPSEYTSARLEGDVIVATNAKQKGGKKATKRIPVSPMLAPYITDGRVANSKVMWREIKKILPAHKLYDLRTTFCSRCTEAEIDPTAIKLMMGHSLGKLGNAYVDVSDDFLRAQIAKLKYDLPPILPPNLPPK